MSLLDHIVRQTGMMRSEVLGLLPTVQRRYKVYDIPKKNGGLRSIAQPAREVKALQYALMSGLLCKLEVHPHATAYRNGVGLITNAAPHAGHNAILKMDFISFFNSIKQKDFEIYLLGYEDLTPEDIEIASLICFWKPSWKAEPILSVGAPSSPQISNALLHRLDQKLLEMARSAGAQYTRYADDLTFSHPSAGNLWSLYPDLCEVIKASDHPKLRINGEKTRVFSPAHRRSITGLTVSNDGLVSLGRARKRHIQSCCHRFLMGKLGPEGVRELGGWLSFAGAVEPAFITRLEAKYKKPVHRLVADMISKEDKRTRAA